MMGKSICLIGLGLVAVFLCESGMTAALARSTPSRPGPIWDETGVDYPLPEIPDIREVPIEVARTRRLARVSALAQGANEEQAMATMLAIPTKPEDRKAGHPLALWEPVRDVLSGAAQAPWAVRSSAHGAHFYGVASCAGRHVACGANGAIYTSTNGSHWMACNSGQSGLLLNVNGDGPLWVVVGAGGTILTATNGTAWVARASPTNALFRGVAYGNGVYVACGDNGALVRSTNGITWNVVASGTTKSLQGVGFGKDFVTGDGAGGVSDRDTALLRVLKRKTGCRVLETNVFGSTDLTVPDPIDLHAHISRWDLWRWRRWLWPFRRPGIYLPYCVDTAAFRPVPPDAFRRAHGIPGEALVVGRIGKTDWDELRKAVIPALRDCPRVVFVSVDDYSGAAEDFAGWPAGCRARVVRVPALRGADALSAFYSACDLTLNFSPIGESFGYVVAEAMACGTPVIAHSKPRNDNAQVEIADARFGAYPVSTAEAAFGVIRACADTPPAPEQRERCRDSIIRRYSLDVFAPRLDLAYRTLAETKCRGRALERTFARLGFETDIPNSEIAERLGRVVGEKPAVVERVKAHLAHSLPNALRLQRICRRDFPDRVPDELKERLS